MGAWMRFVGMVLGLALLLTVGGCALISGRAEQAELISVEFVRDPETGLVTRLSHWRYPGGDVVTTQDRLGKEISVTDRRAGRAPTRVVLPD
jgi:hypothetical protein